MTAAAAVASATALLLLLGPVPLGAQILLLGLGVAAVGVPHGALDHWPARRLLEPRLGWWWPLGFGLFYAALAALVLLGWFLLPSLTLLGFLLLSVLHFGLGDAEGTAGSRVAEVPARGGVAVAAPILFHPDETALLFGWLTGDGAAAGAAVAAWRWPVAALWGGACLFWVASRPRTGALAELAVVALGFALLPPLLGFALYFCLVHSPRHFLFLAAWRGVALGQVLRAALPLTLATFALAGLGAFLLLEHHAAEVALLRTLFWGLSALTVPHMVLTALALRLSAPAPAPSGARGDARAAPASAGGRGRRC